MPRALRDALKKIEEELVDGEDTQGQKEEEEEANSGHEGNVLQYDSKHRILAVHMRAHRDTPLSAIADVQWNSSIYSELFYSNPLNENTTVHSGTSLFQHPEMKTPLYTMNSFILTPE